MPQRTPLRQLPVVMISMSRWDGDFSSAAYSLAKSLAKSNPVIYVDYPYTWLDVWRERKLPTVSRRIPALVQGKNGLSNIPGQSPQLYALTPPAMWPINFLEEGALYAAGLAHNNRMLFAAIERAVKSLGFDDFLFFNSFNPLYGQQLPARWKHLPMVYQSRDSIRALEPYLRKHGVRLETEAIRQADLAIATSSELVRILSEASGKKVEHLPNAADISVFRKAVESKFEEPKELQGLRRPIIGYTGNICQRVDYELLQKLCAAHADKTVVLVGPRNHWQHTQIDLDAIPNLVFTGARKLEELPPYLQHFDVVLIPFVKSELTASIYPLKINEYLAAGMPVVATNFSADMARFADRIWLANDHDAFIAAIDEAMQHNSAEERQQRLAGAEGDSWDARVEQLWQLLEKTPKAQAYL